MYTDGTMLVHPALAGKNIKVLLPHVYDALSQADANGKWVTYEHPAGMIKNAYVEANKKWLDCGKRLLGVLR